MGCCKGGGAFTLRPRAKIGIEPGLPLIIETKGLTKVYGQQRALDSVDLEVAPGSIGLLGPNGAGKSTFMKCLLQLQPITSGSARLLGRGGGTKGREIRERVGSHPTPDCHDP